MEDQQPAAGDLTVDAASETDVTETVEAGTPQSETDAAEETVSDTDEKVDAGDEEADEKAKDKRKKKKTKKARRSRTNRRTGKWVAAAVAVLATLLFVGSAAFAGATMHTYLSERATVETKLKVARTAANAITTLWSYTPENMDTLADRAATYLYGDFAAQYRKFVDAIAAPNKQAKISNSTEVTGAAVESLNGPNAVAIVYTNTTSKSPLTKNIPTLKYLSYRLIMKLDHGNWMVTRMTTVTSLDLTPHL